MTNNTWVIIGIIATGFAAGIIPYVALRKSIRKRQTLIMASKSISRETEKKQETSEK
ncbi:MAG: hypothetical protein CSYNP_02777 [Syntrophus sp. SKADARSKE-3]|nr:hypothetical protein [Syntrophus sp. SKADARSKE-3]